MLSLTREPQAIIPNQLSYAVEFYQVFLVESGGLVRLYNDYAPDVYGDPENDLVIDNPSWEFFSYGYTQQYAYSGPVMHDSEMLRGSLAEESPSLTKSVGAGVHPLSRLTKNSTAHTTPHYKERQECLLPTWASPRPQVQRR